MTYSAAWSIEVPCNEEQYKWLDKLVDAANDVLGEQDYPTDELLAKYPTLSPNTYMSDTLTLEHVAPNAILYNNSLEGGVDQGAEIICAYLKHFDLPYRAPVLFAWVDRNEGGGSVARVTKHGIKWVTLDEMLAKLMNEGEIDLFPEITCDLKR